MPGETKTPMGGNFSLSANNYRNASVRVGAYMMQKLLLNSLKVLPAIALLIGTLVCLDLFPVRVVRGTAVFVVWNCGTFACWVLTVILAGSVILGRNWHSFPPNILAVTGTFAAGLAGLLQWSVLFFSAVFTLTIAASVVAIRAGLLTWFFAYTGGLLLQQFAVFKKYGGNQSRRRESNH